MFIFDGGTLETAEIARRTRQRRLELGGTRSALDTCNLHRHWRNARTHTLHEPARWKLQHIGRYTLHNQLPPRHGVL